MYIERDRDWDLNGDEGVARRLGSKGQNLAEMPGFDTSADGERPPHIVQLWSVYAVCGLFTALSGSISGLFRKTKRLETHALKNPNEEPPETKQHKQAQKMWK